MRLRKLLDLYSEQRDVEPGTKKWLAVALGRFERHLARPAELADLNDAALNEWVAAEIASGSIARRTVKGYRGGVIMLWRFAVEEDLVDRPPFKLRRIKLPKMVPCAWHPSEAASLLPLARLMGGNYACGVSKAAFWTALILAIWDSGLRLGDALRIKAGDFNASGAGCIIQKKTGWPKPFQFSAAAIVAIRAIQDPARPLVFGGIVSKKTIYKTMNKLAKSAGLSGGTKKLRKSGATAAEQATPGSATGYLGHKTRQMAYDSYVDPRLLADCARTPPPLLT